MLGTTGATETQGTDGPTILPLRDVSVDQDTILILGEVWRRQVCKYTFHEGYSADIGAVSCAEHLFVVRCH